MSCSELEGMGHDMFDDSPIQKLIFQSKLLVITRG